MPLCGLYLTLSVTTSLSLGVTLLCYRLGLVVALRLVQGGEEPAKLAQLLTGCQALLLQALVILSQVGHLCKQRHFILFLLVVERQRRRNKWEDYTCALNRKPRRLA